LVCCFEQIHLGKVTVVRSNFGTWPMYVDILLFGTELMMYLFIWLHMNLK
jgi:hypothetical protein